MNGTTHPFPALILQPDDLPSIDRGNGARTTPLVTTDRGATAFLNGITTFAPGAAISHHFHNCAESVMVIEGDAIVDVDGQQTPLQPFAVTFVPANIPHHFRNASGTEPMRIFWTYSSTDATRTLAATDTATRIDAEQRSSPESTDVTEIVELYVTAGQTDRFERAISEASLLFQRSTGCRSFELTQSVEKPHHYRLFIKWSALDDHLDFRSSESFEEWRALIMPLLTAPPGDLHVRHISKGF